MGRGLRGCDVLRYLVATPETTFAITPAKLGIPYNLSGLLTLINAVPLPVAKEMLFTAQPIPATQALNLGIVNYLQPADKIEPFVYQLTAQICRNAPLSVTVMKGGEIARERARHHPRALRADSGPAAHCLR